MENKRHLKTGKIGMNKDAHEGNLSEHEYTHALNLNIEDDSGNGIPNAQNEHSNLLCSRFKEGFFVVGFKLDINRDRVWFFITNPETNVSEIGYISAIQNIDNIEELDKRCGCDYKKILNEPLELQEQIEHCEYITVLSDSCNKCLNFSINYPIQSIVLNNDILYFTDVLNSQRRFDTLNVEQYKFKRKSVCGEDPILNCDEDERCEDCDNCDECPDCDKLKIFSDYKIPCIKPESIINGGTLTQGTYSYAIAYSDAIGNNITEFTSLTNFIPIYDNFDRQQDQIEQNKITNLGIKLTIDNLEPTFDYFVVAVLYRDGLQGDIRIFRVGVFSIDTTEILHTTNQGLSSGINQTDLSAVFTKWLSAEGLTESSGFLFQYGLTEREDINLQQIAILISPFLKWIMGVANESLYKDGVGHANYSGYYRDEVYPFSLKFLMEDGHISSPVILTHRPPSKTGDFGSNDFYELVNDDGDVIETFPEGDNVPNGVPIDVSSVVQNSPDCDKGRRYKWQFYNTAEITEGTCEEWDSDNVDEIEEKSPISCQDEVESISNGELQLNSLPLDYTNLVDFINNNKEEFGVSKLYENASIDDALNGEYELCIPETECELEDNPLVEVFASEVVNEVVNTDYRQLSSYPRTSPPSTCNQIQIDPTTSNPVVDTVNNALYPVAGTNIYRRLSNTGIQSCTTPILLTPDLPSGVYLDYEGGAPTTKIPFKQSISIEGACVNNTTWLDVLHTKAIWLRGNFNGRDRAIIEISQNSSCDLLDDFFTNSSVRVTTYDNCIPTGTTIDRFCKITGNSGTVGIQITENVTVNSYTVTWNTDLNTTLNNFVTTHGANISVAYPGLSVVVEGGRLKFSYNIAQTITFTGVSSTGLNIVVEGFNKTCNIVNLSSGLLIELDRANFASDNFLIAIDAPIIQYPTSPDPVFLLEAPCGCFNVVQRIPIIERIRITYDLLRFKQRVDYVQVCLVPVPKVDNCSVLPYKEGEFGYWESVRTYPDNKFLFDASTLEISEDILTNFINDNPDLNFVKDKFEELFTDGIDNGKYILKGKGFTDLRCEPIRHYKFPGNDIAPFTFNSVSSFQESIIFPLGVKLDNRIINLFLDIAAESGVMTKEYRSKIVGYEVLRGSRVIDKGIVSRGILFDMYKYKEDLDLNNPNTALSQEVLYSNYPFNSLGEDQLRFADNGRTATIKHPFDSLSQNRWTFHSPDIHLKFPAPNLPQEIIVDGYLYGSSSGKFNEVEDHPKYVVLGTPAKALAISLAILEQALETAIVVGNSYLEYAKTQWAVAGTVVGGGLAGTATATPWIAYIQLAQFAVSTTFGVGRKRYEWLRIFRENGAPRNFAYKYAADGYYNFFKSPENAWGNKLRGLTRAEYLKANNRYSLLDKTERITINHQDRESCAFLSTGKSENDKFNINYPSTYINYDNTELNLQVASRRYASQPGALGNGSEFYSNIGSPYITLKQYLPAQYGDIYNIIWEPTNYCGKLLEDNKCDIIFGGDIRISRIAIKRKMSMFNVTAFGQANFTPFAYSLYNNIGNNRFYIDLDINLDDSFNLTNALFPDIGSSYGTASDRTLDQFKSSFYIKPPSKFYLYYYGIARFLCESEVNSNFRSAGKEPHQLFYPEGGTADYNWWTQERIVPIQRDNHYRFNNIYVNYINAERRKLEGVSYDPIQQRELNKRTQAVIVSKRKASQYDDLDNIVDAWRLYNPSDVFIFPEAAGKLYELKSIESEKLLARFKNQLMLLNSIDKIRERTEKGNRNTGMGVFAERPMEFKRTDLGIFGTQMQKSISTPYGYFWADAKRGAVIWVDNAGESPVDIASSNRSKESSPTFMRNWFKKHLPFKILNSSIQNLTEDNLDNAMNGIGITMGWDDRFRRVFLTKKDYILKPEYKGTVEYKDKGFYIENTEIKITDSKYFEDVSFTISFSPIVQRWISFYSFKPNYYISHQNYFQTGINKEGDEKGIWSHLLTNQSFNVFYGKKYPFVIEVPSKSNLVNKMLSSIEYWTETRRYLVDSYTIRTDLGFDKATIFNNRAISGDLKLITEIPNNLKQRVSYPKTFNTYSEILQSSDEGKFTFNQFFNRLKSNTNNLPIWIYDKNEIEKTLNPNALITTPRGIQDRIKGDWFLVKYEYDKDSRWKFICRWWVLKESEYL